METSATTAQWAFDQGSGDRLTLWDSVQASSTVIPVVSSALTVDAENVRVIAPHTGGGFGAKGYIWPHEILSAAAARVVGRPVKLQLRRSDQFSNVGYQPWMAQTVRLAADADGVLLGIEHEVVNNAGLVDTHVEPATEASKSMYAAPSIRLRQLIERVSLNVPTPMRAPVEGPGLWALESAMNELGGMRSATRTILSGSEPDAASRMATLPPLSMSASTSTLPSATLSPVASCTRTKLRAGSNSSLKVAVNV